MLKAGLRGLFPKLHSLRICARLLLREGIFRFSRTSGFLLAAMPPRTPFIRFASARDCAPATLLSNSSGYASCTLITNNGSDRSRKPFGPSSLPQRTFHSFQPTLLNYVFPSLVRFNNGTHPRRSFHLFIPVSEPCTVCTSPLRRHKARKVQDVSHAAQAHPK